MSENKEDLKNKIIYRASYRGTKEMDTLMLSFVNNILEDISDISLEILDEFVNFDDEKLMFIKKKEISEQYKISFPNRFRSKIYEGSNTYTSEAAIDLAGTRYMFLVVNDFNQSVHDVVTVLYENSFMSDNILARLVMREGKGVIMFDDYSVIEGETKAVNEFFQNKKIKKNFLKAKYSQTPYYYIKN